MRVCFLLLMLAVLALPARAQEAAPAATTPAVTAGTAEDAPELLPAGTTRYVVTYRDVKRSYLLHIPQKLANGPASLVIAFHGLGASAAGMEQLSGLSNLSEKYGFVVAYPEADGNPRSWNTGTNEQGTIDVHFVEHIIKAANGHAIIAPSRVFVTGISSGAQMAARLVCVMPNQIAAAALVAANYPQWSDCNSRPVSIMLFHGSNDQIAPIGGHLLQMGPMGYAERMARQNMCPNGPGDVFKEADTSAIGWGNCAAKTEIVAFTFEGKGHSWPGSNMPADITSKTLSASGVMWQFFDTHPQVRYRPRRNNTEARAAD